MRRSITRLLSLALFLQIAPAVFAEEIDEKGCVIGRWTADLQAARDYARTNNTFFILNFGQDGGCAFCLQAAIGIYNRPDFKQWLIDNNIPSAYCDYNRGANDALVREVMRLYPTAVSFPALIMVDERENGTKGAGTRQIGMFYNVANTLYNGIYFDPFVPTNFIRIVDSYLNYNDDVIGPGVPTLSATAVPQRYGLYHNYGTNSLDAVRAKSPNANVLYQYADSNDWFSVVNVVTGRQYTIKAVDVYDPEGLGRVEFYSSKKNAQTNGYFDAMSLTELASKPSGYTYVATEGGTNYIRFTRDSYRDGAFIKYATVKYAIEYSYSEKAKEPTVMFLASSADVPDTTNRVDLTIERTNYVDSAVTATYRTEDVTASNGVDYIVAGGAGTGPLGAGVTNVTVSIPLIPDTQHIWKGDRSFRVLLTPGSGYVIGALTNLTVTLKETDAERDAFDPAAGGESALTNAYGLAMLAGPVTNLSATLNGGDGTDVFVFTNLVANQRYRYYFSGVTNINGGTVQAALYTNRVTTADALTNAWLPVIQVTNGALQVFSPSTTNAVYVKIWRVGATQPACVKYTLGYMEWPRAVIGFDADSRTVAATNGQACVTLAVERTTQTGEVSVVRFRTLPGSALPGTDYTPVDSNLTFAAGETIQTVTVGLCYARDGWTGARAFAAVIEPIGDVTTSLWATATVTLASDTVDDAYVSDGSWSNACPLAGTVETVSSGTRYLNGADTNDWFVFTPVTTGREYRVRLKNVVAKSAAPTAGFYYTNAVPVPGQTGIAWTALTNVFWHPVVFNSAVVTNGAWLCLSRPPENTNGYFRYTLEFREWIKPWIGFETDTLTRNEADGLLNLKVHRTNNLEVAQEVAYQILPSTALYGRDYTASETNGTLVFAEGVAEQVISVNLLADNVWRRDRSFQVRLTVDAETDAVYTNLTVTIRDKDAPYDGKDGADGTADATPATATALSMLRTEQAHTASLNGADTTDCFVFTNLEAHVRYYVAMTNVVTAYATPKAWFYANRTEADAGNAWTNLPLSALAQGRWDFTPETSGDVYMKLTQEKDGGAEVDACVKYTLLYAAWPRPVISLGAETMELAASASSAVVTLWRTNNTDEATGLTYWTVDLPDGRAVAGTDYTAVSNRIELAAGVTNTTVALTVVPDTDAVWHPNRRFGFRVAADAGADVESGITNLTVTLLEKDPAFDARDGADGSADAAVEDATPLPMDKTQQTLSGSLNGADTTDWFRFSNIQSGGLYRVGIEGLTDTGTESPSAVFYTRMAPETVWTNLTLAELVSSPLLYRADSTNDLYLKIERAADDAVCVKYTLTFKQMLCWIRFATNAVTVSEAASEVPLQVICRTEGALDADARVTVQTRDGSATADDDYAATRVQLVWPAGSTGGVQTVRIPLRNYDSRWEGDETFEAVLTPDPDTAQAEDPAEIAVTLTEKDAPVAGTLTLVGYGEKTNTFSRATKVSVREGEDLILWVQRSGGSDGALQAVVTWQDGTIKVVETRNLFESSEDGLKPLTVSVPVRGGYQAVRSVTLTLSAPGARTSGGTLTLAVTDEAYLQALSAYSADNRSRLPLVSSSGAWFVTGDGETLRCLTPAAKQSSVMQVTVTGPGELRFFAETVQADGCDFSVRVSGGASQTITPGVTNTVTVAAGTKTVVWTFTRSATASADAYAAISGLTWIPDPSFETQGAFAGYAWFDNGDLHYGLAAMTVAASGRISGSLRFATRAYTFTSEGYDGESDGVYTATAHARGNGETFDLAISVTTNGCATLTDAESSVGAELGRNGWNDKPLSSGRAEAMERCEGYYTLVLPNAEPSDEDVFGSGYLGVTVARNGSVKAAGKLADGRSVSLSGTLLLDADGAPYTVFFTAPSAYRGGYLAAKFNFVTNDAGVTVLWGNGAGAVWINRSSRATGLEGGGFHRELDVVGGYYDRTETLKAYYEGEPLQVGALEQMPELSYTTRNGGAYSTQTTQAVVWATSESPVELAVNESGTGFIVTSGSSGSRALFTLSANRITGLFSGYVRATYGYESLAGRSVETTRSYRYQGVLVPQRATPEDGVAGRGYFVAPARSDDGSYTFNQSYDLTIEDRVR